MTSRTYYSSPGKTNLTLIPGLTLLTFHYSSTSNQSIGHLALTFFFFCGLFQGTVSTSDAIASSGGRFVKDNLQTM